MKILGLIPARGGSKGIPYKNIKPLCNKPLISYAIEDALKSNLLDEVIISTDSNDIAEVATKYGCKVPFIRPTYLAADETPTVSVIKHAISHFDSNDINFDAVCLIQPTSPFKSPNFIDICIKKFIQAGADSLISVLEVPHQFNPHWTFVADQKKYFRIATGEENIIPRRQELPKAYYRDGSIYISKRHLILTKNQIVGGKIVGIESDPELYCNIDTIEDWIKAEQICNGR